MFDDLMETVDLSCFCDLSPVSSLELLPELTEAALQEIEQRAEDWYLSMM